MIITGKYPDLRLRRSRQHEWSRRLVKENNLSANDLIQPIFLVEGKNKNEQIHLLKSAKKIEKAGAFSIVLECIEKKTAERISKSLKIPTIGIGSSNLCDGQILVTDDMLGLSGFYPKFVKKYANLEKTIDKAIKQFNKEVKLSKFPLGKNSF